jgi:hypothetical protein
MKLHDRCTDYKRTGQGQEEITKIEMLLVILHMVFSFYKKNSIRNIIYASVHGTLSAIVRQEGHV